MLSDSFHGTHRAFMGKKERGFHGEQPAVFKGIWPTVIIGDRLSKWRCLSTNHS